jgi:hypothetical protein
LHVAPPTCQFFQIQKNVETEKTKRALSGYDLTFNLDAFLRLNRRGKLRQSIQHCLQPLQTCRIWQKESWQSRDEVRLFTAQNDSMTYAIGPERKTVRATDGSALPAAPQSSPTEHAWELRGDNGVEIDRRTGKVVA